MTKQSFKALSKVADAAVAISHTEDADCTDLYMAMRDAYLVVRGYDHVSSGPTFESLANVARAATLAHKRDDGTQLYIAMLDVHAPTRTARQ